MNEQGLRRRVVEFVSGVQTGVLSHSKSTDGILELITGYGDQRELEGRIHENEDWARHIGLAWDSEVVNHEDVHKRLAELKVKETK